MAQRFLLLSLALVLGGARLNATEHPLVFDCAQSRIEIIVKATLGSFTGRLTVFEPTAAVNDLGRVVAAQLCFHLRDVSTGCQRRDRAMHDWQQTDLHPDGRFVLTGVVVGRDGVLRADGLLSLHGVTQEISFPVSVVHAAEVLAIDGNAAADVREFGLPELRWFGLLKVDPVVHVRFHLQGRAAF